MCCFTQPVGHVNNTRIYTRAEDNERQFVVYQMELESSGDLAMVLPLPVKPGSNEHALAFISLKDYPQFFDDLETGFSPPQQEDTKPKNTCEAVNLLIPLPVVAVGNFEASFVPTEKDFSRLDARFRLPPRIWKKPLIYETYGFAVFKLKSGTQKIHPMAFSFPRSNSQTLFFPTLHIHDGRMHPTADFDHLLYCQPRTGEPLKFDAAHAWDESLGQPRSFMKTELAQGLIQPDEHCYKTMMKGELPNQDTFVALDS